MRQNNDHQAQWILSWIVERKPDTDHISLDLKPPHNTIKIKAADWHIEEMDNDVNWLERSYQQFSPFSVGSFFIYGSHYEDDIPVDKTGLQIDAATAFGSGEHATTEGCLQALETLKEKKFAPSQTLDMGTGSGILAIAAVKLWPQTPVLAIDIEEESVRVAKHHADINKIKPSQMTCRHGDGFAIPAVQNGAPFDLIIANILAGPLIDMADDLAACLSHDGYVLLSGMLQIQAEDVMSAYKTHHIALKDRYDIGDWSSLLLQKSA